MYIYIVKHDEDLNYIGHGLYNTATYEHGIYMNPVEAEQKVKQLSKEEGIEAYIDRRWITE